MAFKLKSALNFGQKSSFKMRSYSPNKQEEGGSSKKPPMSRLSKRTLDRKLKDYLMDKKGFNQADADRMIKDGAYTYKDMIKDLSPRKDSPNKQGLIMDDQTYDWLRTLTTPNPSKEEKERARKAKIEYDKKYSKKNKKKIDSPADGGTLPEVTVKPKSSPNKQEGPIDKKNLPLQPGEMEGTYVYEGKDMRERIIDLEDRAGFLLDNDIPDLEGSTDPKDIRRVKKLKATAKRLQSEADIMRKRMKNKKSAVKQTSQDDFKPAYPGADYSKEDIAKMTRKEKEMKIDGYDPALDPTQPEYKKRKQLKDPKAMKSPMKGYKSDAQRKAVHASKADGGKGNPNKMKKSPAKMDPMTAMALASSLKGAKDKDDKKGLDIVSMAPSAMKKNKKK